jgi:hypothetical protein
MRLHFLGSFDVSDYQRLGVTKSDDLLILRYPELYRDKIRAEMRKIVEKNTKNKANGKEPVELDVSIDIRYQRRSTNANRWMWAIHTLEAQIINGKGMAGTAHGMKWVNSSAVTPEMIHEDYLEQYAKQDYFYASASMVNEARGMIIEGAGRILEEKWIPEFSMMSFLVFKTSSFMNAGEFYEFSEHIKTQLLSYGVDLDNASDYSTLMKEREHIYKAMVEAEKKEAEDNVPQSAESVDDIPILTFKKDPVSIVNEVSGGTECTK